MRIFFWLLLILIVYCYFGYPFLINVLAKWFSRPVRKNNYEPTISVVLSVWNEEDVIVKKLNNLLSLEYPAEKIEFLIGSDGSTDKTNEIIRSVQDSRIFLVENSFRRGKMLTLNDLAAKAQHEIIVFTDARQVFAKDALKNLAANFADEEIGCVSGELIFSSEEGATAKGINLYWSYEKYIRQAESSVHSMLGATGAIYAIRRALYEDVPDNVVLDDMFIPFKIIQKGYRAVLDASAKAYDKAADSPREEYKRKTRTLYGNYQIFRIFCELFNPFKSPIAFQFFSHKLLRILIPFFMIAIFFLNVFLMSELFYGWMFAAQIVFYIMAILGALTRYQKYGMLKAVARLCYVPYVFCLLNFSALIGFLRFAGARQEITWEKARER